MEDTGAKRCGTCKHFEPASEWRRGWCRNTLLFAPSQSHMVQSEELDCSRGARSFWEPIPQVNAGQHDVKLPTFENPLNLFAPAFAGATPAAAGNAGSHMMFASSGSGSGRGGGYDDDDYSFDDDYGYDDEPVQDEPAERRPQSNRTRRSSSAGRGGANGSRSRSASAQPDERYWTDYLRIALPVIGIILMLGLLWVWASSLLGGDNNEVDPTPDDSVGLVQTQTPDPNAVNPNITAESTPNGQTNAGEIPISQPTTAPTNPATTATETPAAGGDNQTGEEAETPLEITVGGLVEITEEANIRPSAGTAGDPLGTAAPGDIAEVASGPEEADGYTWWELVFEDGSNGFIADEFLEPVPAD